MRHPADRFPMLDCTVTLVDGTKYRARATRVADEGDVAVYRLVVGNLDDVAQVGVVELPGRSTLLVRGLL